MRPTVLTFVSCYLPGYKAGGPVRSIANFVHHLGDEFDIRIVTADRDLGDKAPYPDLCKGQWHSVGKAKVMYLSRKRQGLSYIAGLMRQIPHELLYLNSFLHPRFTILPLLARRLGLAPRMPTIIAPRGEFSLGALNLKPFKKRGFIAASRMIGLYHGISWQASTVHEADDIHRIIGAKAPVFLASDLPAPVFAPSLPCIARDHAAPLRVVFFSRISPMKNLLFALDVLKQVRVPLAFSIYGPVEDRRYWAECEAAIESLPANIKVEYRGSIDPGQVITELAKHDLFFLPTCGENYGHVIAEALLAGLPLLLSDQTPWRDLSRHGVGKDLSLEDAQPFVEFIEEAANWDKDSRQAILGKVRKFAAKAVDPTPAVSANREMFRQICKRG